MKSQISGSTSISYEQRGDQPRLLFISGKHGDEFETIGSVQRALLKYSELLPDFVYIPEASPSAVKLKTRQNAAGVDLNRVFFSGTIVDEARAIMAIAKKFHFHTCISFHEDLGCEKFYLYDEGEKALSRKELKRLFSPIQTLGIGLLTGYDDPDDQILGYWFANGYKHITDRFVENGSLSRWLFHHRLIKRFICPEIPGKLPVSQKDQLVDSLFQTLVLGNEWRREGKIKVKSSSRLLGASV